MEHLGLHGQMVFKGCEEIANQEQVNFKQNSMSKISRMGCTLPNISKLEYFKFNSKVDFTTQKTSIKSYWC